MFVMGGDIRQYFGRSIAVFSHLVRTSTAVNQRVLAAWCIGPEQSMQWYEKDKSSEHAIDYM